MRCIVVGILLLSVPVTAQWRRLWQKPAPELRVDSWVHAPEARSLEGLRGKVVLLALWADPARVRPGHVEQLQELHKQYEDRGLRVVAIVRDEASALARRAKSHRITFGLARAVGFKEYIFMDQWLNPQLYLIDPEGVVVWQGHPMLFGAGHVERLLPAVREFLIEGKGESADAFRSGRLSEASLDETLRPRVDALLDYWKGQVALGRDLQRYAQVFSSLERIQRHFPGSPHAAWAADTKRELQSDANVRRERAAESKLSGLRDRARRARKEREVEAVARDLKRLVDSRPAPSCGPEAARLLDALRSRLAPLEHTPPTVRKEPLRDCVGFARPGPHYERGRPKIRIAKHLNKPRLSITRLFFCRVETARSPRNESVFRHVEVGLWTPGRGEVFEVDVRRSKSAWSVRPRLALLDGVYCVHTGEIGGDQATVPEFCAPFVVGGYAKPILASTGVRIIPKNTVLLTVELENAGDGAFHGGLLVTTVQQVGVVTGRRKPRSSFRGRQNLRVDGLAPGDRKTMRIEWDWSKYGAGTFYFTVGLNYFDLWDANRIFNGKSRSFSIGE